MRLVPGQDRQEGARLPEFPVARIASRGFQVLPGSDRFSQPAIVTAGCRICAVPLPTLRHH
jgi:hypothetical protein